MASKYTPINAANIADTIKELRMASGLTQQELADKVGITRRSVIRIEQDMNSASFEVICEIMKALNKTIYVK